MSTQRKEYPSWRTQSMEAHDEPFYRKRERLSLKFRRRCLVIAALAVGIALASPAIAQCPKPSQMHLPRTPAAAKFWAQTQLVHYGWNTPAQWKALNQLWTNESNWRCNAKNHTPVYLKVNGQWVKFYAGGIPQCIGLNPKASVQTQIKVGLDYIKARYGSPVAALRFWNRHNYY